MIDVLRMGGLYFAFVFAAGFALGTVRTRWMVPQPGARTGGAAALIPCGLSLHSGRDPDPFVAG